MRSCIREGGGYDDMDARPSENHMTARRSSVTNASKKQLWLTTLIDRGWLSAWAFCAAVITLVAVLLNHNAREARHAAAADELERA